MKSNSRARFFFTNPFEKIKLKLLIFILFSSFVAISSCSNSNTRIITPVQEFVSKFRKVDYSNISNYELSLHRLLDSLKIESSLLKIIVDKSDYVLSVCYDSITIKQYPIVLGKNPLDDKLQQGDNCTPEGEFKIKAKYEHEKWSRFIWLDYPNEESFSKIMKAKEAGIINKEASPGGEIGIHGVEEGFDYAIDYGINWTSGCIALKNKDINELYTFVNDNTKILILK